MRNLMKICTVLFWHLIALFSILSSLYITLIMGRAPCCEKLGIKKGPWTNEEDHRLKQYIQHYGDGCWRTLPKKAGLSRCGKSCRLRWINYLQPNLKRGNITEEEDRIIIESHAAMGNRWSMIASKLPGRTDNEIKNYWNTHLKKKLRNMGLDPKTHQPLQLRNMGLDPKTYQPLQLPNMGLNPKTHQPLQVRNMGLDPKTYQPLQLHNMGLDPNTHQPLQLPNMGLDPKTHQPLQLPNMGLDPKTHQPLQLPNMGLDPKTHQPLQLLNMCLDPKTHQPLQGTSTSSTSIPEMIKMEARSVKGKNSISKDLCCGEIVFSPSYNFSEDYKFPPSSRSNFRTTTNLAPLQPSPYYFNEACKFTMCQCISLSSSSDTRDTSKNIAPVKLEVGPEPQANSITNLANHMTANCRSTSDIRDRGTNIAHRKVKLSPGPQANSITNLVPSWSGFNILDSVNHCPAAVSSTKGQDVGSNTIATNTVNSMSVDNDPSAMDVPTFSNVSSSNPMLSLVGNGHLWDSPIINMGEEHSSVEEESEAAAQWARAFNDRWA